ncbi:hypothetical protein FRC10_000898 [Ceratobasidium sp. 414]|nr:hypothetical protein FRC10_000898 [Ceratobasidium sp. 414]
MATRYLAASASAQSTVTEFVTAAAGVAAPSAPAEAVNSPSVAPTAAPTATAGAGNGTAAAPGNNKNGFSQADLNTAIQGGLTNATAPTADNSIGLQDDSALLRATSTCCSADMWVGGEACKSQQGGGCGNHTFLGIQPSSSFKSLGKNFQVTYGTGQVKGDIITDDIVVAGLKLPAHTFGVATEESVDFSSNDTHFDGLVGLAQSILANQSVPTPPESFAKAGLIHHLVQDLALDRRQERRRDHLWRHRPDQDRPFHADKIGFWQVPFTPSVGGKDLGLSGRTAILDTGTSLITAPPADALALHQQIPGAKSDGNGGFTIPCTTDAQVSFKMGAQDFLIDPRDLLFVPVDQSNLQGDCVSGITSGQIGGAQGWLVGMCF